MELNKIKIFNLLEEHRDEIQKLGVKKLGLFGSAVRGDISTESDIDFLVEFENKSFDAYMDLKFFLEDLFHRKVDLVTTEAIKPRLRSRILEEAVYAPGL